MEVDPPVISIVQEIKENLWGDSWFNKTDGMAQMSKAITNKDKEVMSNTVFI